MASPTIDSEKELLKKERKRAVNARWRKANPEKVKAANERWQKANREKCRAACARSYANNGDKYKTRKSLWHKTNPEKARASAARFREANPEKRRASTLRWKKENPEKAKALQKRNSLRVYSTPEGKINTAIRTQMRRCLFKTTQTASQLKHSLPYTISELRTHIERQFTKGMSWDNRKDWHIDHIIPLSSFKFTSSADPEFQAAWALTNLRPLWATENLVKNKKRTVLL